MNPVFPDAQPYDTYLLLVAAAAIVWGNRREMFVREGGVVEVVMHPLQALDINGGRYQRRCP